MPASSASKALQDLNTLAQLIPVHGKTTVKQLVKAQGGSEADAAFARRVQHQLNRLQSQYPDELCSDGDRPQGWWWRRGSPLGLDFLTADSAIAFSLVMRYMRQLLPVATLEALEPLQKKSAVVLDQAGRLWADKLLLRRPGPARHLPVVQRAVQRPVYDAILNGDRLLEITYKSRANTRAERRLIWPQALMLKNDLLYLVALKADGPRGRAPEARWYALHRIASATCRSPRGSEAAPQFSLAARDAEGWFSNPGGEREPETIRLVLRVDAVAAVNLIESPLEGMVGAPQTLDDGWVRITADLLWTEDLVTWLHGYGAHAVVEGPPALRARMRDDLAALRRLYAG